MYSHMCLKPACNTCNKTVSHRNLIICAQWFKPIHFKCNNLNFLDDQLIKNSKSSWFCLHCSNIFPFTNITGKKLQSVFSNEEYHVDDYIDNSTKTRLVLKPQENLTNFFNEFNNLSSDQNNNSENIINCKYYDMDEIQALNKLNNKRALSLSHINSCSLSKNIGDLEYLLNSTSINFDVIAISETRIVKGKTSVNSLKLMNFILLNHQLEVRFCTCASTFHINLKMIYLFINLQNWSHHLLRFLMLKDLT